MPLLLCGTRTLIICPHCSSVLRLTDASYIIVFHAANNPKRRHGQWSHRAYPSLLLSISSISYFRQICLSIPRPNITKPRNTTPPSSPAPTNKLTTTCRTSRSKCQSTKNPSRPYSRPQSPRSRRRCRRTPARATRPPSSSMTTGMQLVLEDCFRDATREMAECRTGRYSA